MIKFYPSDAIVSSMGGITSRYYTPNDWWMVYEWFCRRLIEWRPDDTPYEYLNATSSINNHGFNGIGGARGMGPVDRIAYLLRETGPHWMSKDVVFGERAFLRWLGIRSWAAMDKPIKIVGRRPKVFPGGEWFKMGGRLFRKPGPNDSHPNALSVCDFSLAVYAPNKGWVAKIHYGYPHDGGWTIDLYQKRREGLDTFAARIEAWIEEKLEPDVQPGQRRERQTTWGRTNRAVRDLFWADGVVRLDAGIDLPNILVDVPGSSLVEGRIKLDKNKLRTLKRWAGRS